MTTNSTLYDQMINAVKGWPAPYALDKSGPLASGETVKKGQVMSLNEDAEFVLGLSADNAVAVFSLRDSEDTDVASDATVNNSYGWTGGVISGLVCLGPFEIESTEFVAGEYSPNQPLTVAIGANAGKVTAGTYYVDTVVGIVSEGSADWKYGKSKLTFWTCFIPALETESSSSE
jgi:hypothetical protein